MLSSLLEKWFRGLRFISLNRSRDFRSMIFGSFFRLSILERNAIASERRFFFFFYDFQGHFKIFTDLSSFSHFIIIIKRMILVWPWKSNRKSYEIIGQVFIYIYIYFFFLYFHRFFPMMDLQLKLYIFRELNVVFSGR